MNRLSTKGALEVAPSDVIAIEPDLLCDVGSERFDARLMKESFAQSPPPVNEIGYVHGDDAGLDRVAAFEGNVVRRGDHHVDPDLFVDRPIHDGETRPE